MQPQLPKRKGFQLESHEEIFIPRAPSSSITTRKYAPVSADQIMKEARESQLDRFDESISKVSKNGNQFADVNYGNGSNGAKLLYNTNLQGRNPYQISVVRPPEFRLEDTEALSRQRHKDITVNPNPGIQKGYDITNRGEYIDNSDIRRSIDKAKINYLSVKPNSSFTIGKVVPIFVKNSIANKIFSKNVSAAPSLTKNTIQDTKVDTNNYIKDNLLLQNITSGFNISVYNPKTNTFNDISANVKDSMNIAVNASKSLPISVTTKNGINIRLKDYETQVVNSGKRLIIHLPKDNKEYEFEKNVPLYSASSNASGQAQIDHYTPDRFMKDNVEVKNVYSNVNSNSYRPNSFVNNEFTTDKSRNYGSFNNSGSMHNYSDHSIPSLNSGKTLQNRATNAFTDRYSRR